MALLSSNVNYNTFAQIICHIVVNTKWLTVHKVTLEWSKWKMYWSCNFEIYSFTISPLSLFT